MEDLDGKYRHQTESHTLPSLLPPSHHKFLPLKQIGDVNLRALVREVTKVQSVGWLAGQTGHVHICCRGRPGGTWQFTAVKVGASLCCMLLRPSRGYLWEEREIKCG